MIGSRLVARNMMATVATQIVSWGLAFAVTLYLPRYVGAMGLGKLAFASSFITIFGVIVPLGTSSILTREIARDRSRTGELLLASLAIRLPLSALMTLLAVGVIHLLRYPALTQLLVAVTALGMVVGTTNDALGATLQGQENMTRQSVGILVDRFLLSALTIALILLHASLWMLAGAGLLTGLASMLVNLTAFRSVWASLHAPLRERVRTLARAGMLWDRDCLKLALGSMGWPSAASIKSLALMSLPFMGWGVFRTLYGQTDPVVLGFVTNDATVGWYAAAWRLVGTTLFLPTAITSALYPTLSRLYHEDEAQFRHLSHRLLALVMLCGVPISLVLIFLPDRLLALMHFLPQFSHSVPVLRVGGVGVLLWFAASVLGTAIFASDRQNQMFRVSVVASVLGIPACAAGAYLTHHLWHNGAIGAISSDVLLECYLLAAYLKILPRKFFGGESLSLIGRYALASVPMGLFLAVMARQGVGLWVVFPCALIYGAMCWLLRCLGPNDLAMARSVFARKAEA